MSQVTITETKNHRAACAPLPHHHNCFSNHQSLTFSLNLLHHITIARNFAVSVINTGDAMADQTQAACRLLRNNSKQTCWEWNYTGQTSATHFFDLHGEGTAIATTKLGKNATFKHLFPHLDHLVLSHHWRSGFLVEYYLPLKSLKHSISYQKSAVNFYRLDCSCIVMRSTSHSWQSQYFLTSSLVSFLKVLSANTPSLTQYRNSISLASQGNWKGKTWLQTKEFQLMNLNISIFMGWEKSGVSIQNRW